MVPLFSVIVPARDDPLVAEAISSVLHQTLVDFELIVIDDGSEPPLKIADADSRIVTTRHESARGPSAARNAGLDIASGRYVAFLDSDDLFRPQRLAAALQGHAVAPIVIVKPGQKRRYRVYGPTAVPCPPTLLNSTAPALGVTSVARNVIERFDERYLACEDIEWWVRTVKRDLAVVRMNDDAWEWRKGSHDRMLHGSEARLAFSYMLLREHADFFDRFSQAKAFRWRRIAMMERERGAYRESLHAIRNAAQAHLSPETLVDLLRLTHSTLRRRS